MPRFTIGSILTGVTLAVLAIALWQASGGKLLRVRMAPAGTHPDRPDGAIGAGGLMPGAMDPLYGGTVTGPEAANDYELQDANGWDGGQDAATW